MKVFIVCVDWRVGADTVWVCCVLSVPARPRAGVAGLHPSAGVPTSAQTHV